MLQRLSSVVAALVLLLFAVPLSAALLDGQTVQATYYFPDSSTVYAVGANVTVGAGIEYLDFINYFDLDLDDATITASNFASSGRWTGTSFNGFVIRDVNGTIGWFTSVTISPLTNMAGLDASRISFTSDQIFVNWQGLAINPGTVVALDVTGAVPEPTTLVLMASALAGIALRRKLARGNRNITR